MSASQDRAVFLKNLREGREKIAKEQTPEECQKKWQQIHREAEALFSKPENAHHATTLHGIMKLASKDRPP